MTEFRGDVGPCLFQSHEWGDYRRRLAIRKDEEKIDIQEQFSTVNFEAFGKQV